MTTRRKFIKAGSLFSAAFFMDPAELLRRKSLIGLQLYTVRDQMQKDPEGTLAKVAQIGFTSVEAASYTGTQKFYGFSPTEFAKILKQNGLALISAHYRLGEEKAGNDVVKGTMLHEWDKAVADAAEAGIKYMVCAYLSDSERGGIEHYKYVADQLNVAGEKCKKAGIQLCYHNHDFEFVKQGDAFPYDVLLATDKDLVKMELDLYWVSKIGRDPVTLFNANPGRFPLWHLKDMDNSPKQGFAEVGSGVIDFKQIFKHAKKAGLKYYFVEQDITPGSPFDSITKSITYVKEHLQ